MYTSNYGTNRRSNSGNKANSLFPTMSDFRQQALQAGVNAAKNNASSGNSGNSGGSSYNYGSSYNRGSGSRGSGSRGGGGGSAAVSAPAASAPVVQTNPYAEWLAQQRAAVEAAAAAKRQAAQDAYNRGMNALNNAYSSGKNLLTENYNSSLGTMQEAYDNGVAGVNRQADKTQNEAYINYMLSKRDLPQMMTAQGINGGAAESTLASLANQYGNSRNEIDVGRNSNLGDLLQNLNANKASALQAYNSSLADLESRRMAYQMELENALAQQIVSAANTRYDALADIGNTYLSHAQEWAASVQDAAAAAAAATYTANNTPASVSAQQGAYGGGSTNYSLINRLFGTGSTTDDVISQLSGMGYSSSQIQQMLMGYPA